MSPEGLGIGLKPQHGICNMEMFSSPGTARKSDGGSLGFVSLLSGHQEDDPE